MPSRWQLHLRIPARGLQMHHVHGAVSRWLGHTEVGVSDFALGWPQIVSDDITRIEIRLLRDDRELVDRLVEGVHTMQARGGLSLGPDGRRRKVPLESPRTGVPVGSLSLVQALSWEELSDCACPVDVFTVHFLSPYFSRQGRTQLPMPTAGSVVRSLSGRWRTVHPHTAPTVEMDRLGLEIDDLNGRTVHVSMNGVQYEGFVGEATFLVGTADRYQQLQLGRLLAAAPYTGIGSSTAYGFGTVDVA